MNKKVVSKRDFPLIWMELPAFLVYAYKSYRSSTPNGMQVSLLIKPITKVIWLQFTNHGRLIRS